MLPLSNTSVIELRLLSMPEGRRGTGGTDDDRALPGSLLLARRSRRYGEWFRGCSPRGRVAESCWPPPDLYLDARDSLERMNEFTTSARARLVPEMTEDMSSVMADEGVGGLLGFVGSGGGISPELTSTASSVEDRWTLILALVRLLGILIGEGVGFLVEGNALWNGRQAEARYATRIRTHRFVRVLGTLRVVQGRVNE